MKLLVLDTETTGLDITQHELIQIGFLLVDLNADNTYKILKEEEINIKPLHIETADQNALKVNGYKEINWQNTKPINQHFKHIKEKIESCDIMLGQNLIFDLRFIKQAFENFGEPLPQFPPYMDTKWMASQLLSEGFVKSTSMDQMCRHFNIKVDGKAHTALADCKRTLAVWGILSEKIEDISAFTFKNCYDPFRK